MAGPGKMKFNKPKDTKATIKRLMSYFKEYKLAFTIVITNTPRKLNTAAIKIAALGDMDLVDTQVAIALGASVQPFTRITPNVNATVIASTGLEIN